MVGDSPKIICENNSAIAHVILENQNVKIKCVIPEYAWSAKKINKNIVQKMECVLIFILLYVFVFMISQTILQSFVNAGHVIKMEFYKSLGLNQILD